MTRAQPNMAASAPPKGLQGTRKLGAIGQREGSSSLLANGSGLLWAWGGSGCRTGADLVCFYSSSFPGEQFTLAGKHSSPPERMFRIPVSWIWARIGTAGFCPSSLTYSSKLSYVLRGWHNPPRRAEEPKGGGSEVRGHQAGCPLSLHAAPPLHPPHPLPPAFTLPRTFFHI